MKKRYISSLLAGGLMAVMLPGAAMAQMEAEGELIFGDNVTCEFGQGSEAALPACEFSEDGTELTITFINPQDRSGPFEGISVLDGALTARPEEGTFEIGGTLYFAGEVEGCGEGSVLFDYAGGGIQDETGALIFDTNMFTATPGGTLPVTGTIDEIGTNDAIPNGDGTSTLTYTASYACEAA